MILEACIPLMEEKGYELVVNQYDDYVVPNTAVEDGDETPTTSSTSPIWTSSTRPGAPTW